MNNNVDIKNMTVIKKIKIIFSNILYTFSITYQISPKYFFFKCAMLLISGIMPIASMWVWKEIIDYITKYSIWKNEIIILIIFYVILLVFIDLQNIIGGLFYTYYTDKIQSFRDDIMMTKCANIDLAFFDSAALNDKLSIAQGSFDSLTNITWRVFNILSCLINLIIAITVLAGFNVFVALISVLIIIPGFYYNKRHAEKKYIKQKELSRDERKKNYYGSAINDIKIFFESKLNYIGFYFLNEYIHYAEMLYKVNRSIDIKHKIINSFLGILSVINDALVLVLSVYAVSLGITGIGSLQYNINIITRFRGQLSEFVNEINIFIDQNKRLNDLRDFLEIKSIYEKSGSLIPSENPKIEFKNVYFKYPNSEEYVLKNCSFIIESNEKVGLIGINGSGKSTILKLMFRFYDPEKGEILYDGIDIKKYDVHALRAIYGVLFQSYVSYSLTLREVIALSDIDHEYDNERLENACKSSGFSEIIKNWENGFDSYLGRNIDENGKDLSGGQWQLLGLTRAYFKNANFMVLDEPSASLDPITEDKIFERLYKLSHDKSALTISHRLSNTVETDRLLILENGYIIEQGNHFDLLHQNGRYAQLFKLQSKRYE